MISIVSIGDELSCERGRFLGQEAWNLSEHRNGQKNWAVMSADRECFLLLCCQNAVPVGNAITTSFVLRMQPQNATRRWFHSGLLITHKTASDAHRLSL